MMLLQSATAGIAATPGMVLLAFGDSITDGWVSFSSGPQDRYATHLQNALAEYDMQADIRVLGQAGMQAAGALGTLKTHLAQHSYDAVITLLGTNDLYSAFSQGQLPPPEAYDLTLRHLQTLHSAVRDAGARPVALGLLHHPIFDAVPGGCAAVAAFNVRTLHK